MKHRKAQNWSRLDNAAKIFPSTSDKQDTKVFRFTCQLMENVEPEPLQQALLQTLNAFPHFRSVLRRGLFWYFLETSDLSPLVKEETQPPCSALYDPFKRSLLFSVTYYRCRINVEVYHVLTDGAGALQFLRALVFHYLTRIHADLFLDELPAMDFDASLTERTDDSFLRYYLPEKSRAADKTPLAYHMQGAKLGGCRVGVIEGTISVRGAIQKAKEYGASLTVFLTAVLLTAIAGEMSVRERKKPVVASIPVNLRNYFASESVRNFFGVFGAGVSFSEGKIPLEQVISQVREIFARELNADRLAGRMNRLSALEHNPLTRTLPLAIKDPVLRFFGWRAARGETTSLSNLGNVSMPDALAPYIQSFSAFISARRLQLCICSYGDTLKLSFTSPFRSTDVQKRFFRILSGMGLEAEIYSNPIEEE